ncbi:hypothetical protein QTP86_018922 [Hemibagrus guttatus]|nr:hypothetical protein QTP86_018922 [Hemibagrus guttatus]
MERKIAVTMEQVVELKAKPKLQTNTVHSKKSLHCQRGNEKHLIRGMNKVDEKLKVGRTKRPEGGLFNEESQKKQLAPVSAKRESTCHSQAPLIDSEARVSILEHSEMSCSTCSAVTYKTCPGFKKHLKICQKVSGPAK